MKNLKYLRVGTIYGHGCEWYFLPTIIGYRSAAWWDKYTLSLNFGFWRVGIMFFDVRSLKSWIDPDRTPLKNFNLKFKVNR